MKLLVIDVFLRWSAGPDKGLTIGEQDSIHSQSGSAEMKVGVLEPTGPPCANSSSSGQPHARVGLSASLRRQKAVQRIGWLTLRTWQVKLNTHR
jgi:hypothetical protein